MHTIPRLKHGVGKQDTAHIRGSRGRVAEVAASNRQERGADTFEARAFEETHERRTPTKTKPGETRGSGDGRKREREREGGSRVGTRIRWRMRFAEPIGRTGFRTCFAPYMHAGSSIMDGRAVRRLCLSSLFFHRGRGEGASPRNNPQTRLEFDLP